MCIGEHGGYVSDTFETREIYQCLLNMIHLFYIEIEIQ